MATYEERIKIFKELDWKQKIDHLVKFYEAMIKKTDNPEYIQKFQITIDKLQAYEDDEENNTSVLDLYTKILEAEKKTQERKKKENEGQLSKGQEMLKQIHEKEKEEELQEDADDFLHDQLADIGL